MTPQQNYCSLPCAILKKIGRCHSGHGSKQPTSSPSCSANASRTRLTNYEFLAPHTEFLTGPLRASLAIIINIANFDTQQVYVNLKYVYRTWRVDNRPCAIGTYQTLDGFNSRDHSAVPDVCAWPPGQCRQAANAIARPSVRAPPPRAAMRTGLPPNV